MSEQVALEDGAAREAAPTHSLLGPGGSRSGPKDMLALDAELEARLRNGAEGGLTYFLERNFGFPIVEVDHGVTPRPGGHSHRVELSLQLIVHSLWLFVSKVGRNIWKILE